MTRSTSLLLAAGLAAAGVHAQSCTYPTAATLSGFEGTVSGALTSANFRTGFNLVCSTPGQAGTLGVNFYSALVRIDLPSSGSPVQLDTCGSEVDTVITVGTGCPDTTSFGYSCRGYNDDATSNFCSAGASRVTVNATSSALYVMVASYDNSFGAFTLNYRYLAPSQSPTASETSSASQTGSASVTPGLPPSESKTGTARPVLPSGTGSPSVTPSNTPSNSPSFSALPNCITDNGWNGTFRGTRGSTGFKDVPFGSPSLFGSNACGATGITTNPWSQHRLAIDLGNAPLGFPLEINTCTAVGFTSMSTALFAGFGCPPRGSRLAASSPPPRPPAAARACSRASPSPRSRSASCTSWCTAGAPRAPASTT